MLQSNTECPAGKTCILSSTMDQEEWPASYLAIPYIFKDVEHIMVTALQNTIMMLSSHSARHSNFLALLHTFYIFKPHVMPSCICYRTHLVVKQATVHINARDFSGLHEQQNIHSFHWHV